MIFLLFISSIVFAGINEHKMLSSQIASKCFPKLYDSMGTPLYESLTLFETYNHLEGMKGVNRKFRTVMIPIYRHGIELSEKEEIKGVERKTYLKELRTLEAAKKKVMSHLTNLTMKAIDLDDFATFQSLVALPLDELLPTLSTRTKAINYYKTKPQSRIAGLSELAEQERKRKAARMRAKRRNNTAIIEGPRDYQLKQHLPTSQGGSQAYCRSDSEAVSDENSDSQELSTLKKIGVVFKSMGVNFDPGLLEEYKSHKPPAVDDIK
jgi:hypothetical protein